MNRRTVLTLAAASPIVACSRFAEYDAPQVTRVVVQKEERLRALLNNTQVLEAFEIQIGFAPNGHKEQFGDGRTP